MSEQALTHQIGAVADALSRIADQLEPGTSGAARQLERIADAATGIRTALESIDQRLAES
jgi:ABC-type transporter Mla subunit MlaD